MKTLAGEGWIKTGTLPTCRGRPIRLCATQKKALDAFNVTWKQGPGDLRVRATTAYLDTKMNKLRGWTCTLEGDHEGKRVDLLLHDPDHKIVTAEIANNVTHENHDALHCVRYGNVREHVVICLTKKGVKEVEKMFAAVPELASNPTIKILTLAKALGEWMP